MEKNVIRLEREKIESIGVVKVLEELCVMVDSEE